MLGMLEEPLLPLRNFNRRLLFDEFTAAFRRPGIPKRLSCSLEDWPFDILFGASDQREMPTATLEDGVANRSLLVFGASLGG